MKSLFTLTEVEILYGGLIDVPLELVKVVFLLLSDQFEVEVKTDFAFTMLACVLMRL